MGEGEADRRRGWRREKKIYRWRGWGKEKRIGGGMAEGEENI